MESTSWSFSVLKIYSINSSLRDMLLSLTYQDRLVAFVAFVAFVVLSVGFLLLCYKM